MYSSLTKLDLGVAPPNKETKLLIQTDHRRALAITDDAPRSIVFAVTRCLVARRIGEEDPALQPFRVVYQLDGEAPTFFAYAITTAGAILGPENDFSAADAADSAPRLPEFATLIDDACVHVAREVRSREKLEVSVRDLAAYEGKLSVGTAERDYYDAILSIGALAADVVRARVQGATWRHASDEVIPFTLMPPNGAVEHQLRLFGMARRYVDGIRAGRRDVTDAPSTLLGLMFGEIESIRL